MNWLHAVILGIIEGITEFLPVSSTGHLNIVEKLLGYDINDKGITAFTAVIQIGAILAAVIYFWSDIVRIVTAWFKGLRSKSARSNPDYTLGWGIILGSIPVAAVGLVLKDFIEVTARSLWVIAGALIIWSVVMWFADQQSDAPAGATHASVGKDMSQVGVKDALIIGAFQALAPVLPGISRSGGDDLRRTLPALRPRDGHAPVILHGHSRPHRRGPARSGDGGGRHQLAADRVDRHDYRHRRLRPGGLRDDRMAAEVRLLQQVHRLPRLPRDPGRGHYRAGRLRHGRGLLRPIRQCSAIFSDVQQIQRRPAGDLVE